MIYSFSVHIVQQQKSKEKITTRRFQQTKNCIVHAPKKRTQQPVAISSYSCRWFSLSHALCVTFLQCQMLHTHSALRCLRTTLLPLHCEKWSMYATIVSHRLNCESYRENKDSFLLVSTPQVLAVRDKFGPKVNEWQRERDAQWNTQKLCTAVARTERKKIKPNNHLQSQCERTCLYCSNSLPLFLETS